MTLHPAITAVRLPVRRALESLSGTVVVACSGGADSLALASAVIFEGHKAGVRVVGVTVDHGLQDGSAEQAQRVVTQLAEMGVDETMTARVAVAQDSGLGPEAAARQARYAVLAEVAQHLDAAAVFLGHTLDDQAETVLLGLTRGSGARSLAGMRPAFEVFVRPLLGVRRADTLTACLVEGLDVWHDPHNEDPGFTRVRVRHRVLPVLEDELGPGVSQALARTADQLRTDADLLDALADEAWDGVTRADGAGGESGLAIGALAGLHPALRTRVLRRAALLAGSPAAELTRDHVLAVEALVTDWRGQKWIDLPGPVRALRLGDLLAFEPPPSG